MIQLIKKLKFCNPLVWIGLLYIFSAKGHIEIIDTEYSLRTAYAIIESGTMLIEPVDTGIIKRMPNIEGTDKIYSQYGIGLPLIFVPIILLSKFFSTILFVEEGLLTNFLISFYNIPFALLGLWHFKTIIKLLGKNEIFANFLMISLAVCTIFWKYVCTDFSEIVQICFILGSISEYLNIKNHNRWLRVSAYLSLLIIMKLFYVLFLIPFIIIAIHEGFSSRRIIFKNLLQGAIILVPTGLFLMYMNWIRYGSVFQSGYGIQQVAFSFEYFKRDWFDYIFSIDRGVYFYSPILVCSILPLKRLFLDKKSLFFLLFSLILISYFMMASFIGWKGGYCWGNRNLVPIVPLLFIPVAFINFKLVKNKLFFSFMLFISLVIQIIGVSLKTHEWSVLSEEFKDHSDPYYVPNELKGSFLLFYEKIFNSTGIYQANKFVKDHNHTINLSEFESFTGFNFWMVHATKFFKPIYLHQVSLIALSFSVLLSIYIVTVFIYRSFY